MNVRLILAVAFSLAIVIAWGKLNPPPPKAVPPAQTAQTASPTGTDAANAPGTPFAAGAPAAPGTPAAIREANAAKAPQTFDTTEQMGLYRAKFSSWGAAPVEITLLHPQYQENVASSGKKETQPINLVRRTLPELPFTITFPESDFAIAPDAAWTKVRQSEKELVYVWDSDAVHVEKQYLFVPGSYHIDLHVTVENKSDKALNEHLDLAIYGWQDPNIKQGGMFGPRIIVNAGYCDVDGKLKDASKLGKDPAEGQGAVRWLGIDEKYFLLAAAIAPSTTPHTCQVITSPNGTITARLTTEHRTLAPKTSTTYDFAGFLGPKLLDQLDGVKVGGVDAHFGDALNYGWTEAIARPMLAILKAIHSVVPNWGVAIIVLTLLLKAITWYPTSKSMRSMKGMAKLKPEMDKLKVKFGDDKAKMNEAVMQLYKQHNINPIGGCLPMLIQMPIYIALYSMLGNSVELYRSAFFGQIHDLTAPDPYYVLPIVTGILMFVQQKMSPTSADPNQKAMMYTMPVMFLVFTMFLPAGLTIYIFTNTILSMVQQWRTNQEDPSANRPAMKPSRT